MPCDMSKYPSNWKTEIRPTVLLRARNCCEECGVRNYDQGYRDRKGNWNSVLNRDIDREEAHRELAFKSGYKVIKIVLTIAHLDHDTTNNDYSNLKALCQLHHLRYDIQHHKKNSRATVEKKKGLQSLF